MYFSTDKVIELLKKKELGLTFILKEDPNVHIFRTVDNEICLGKYGDGAIFNFNKCKDVYKNSLWIIDFKGSKRRR